MIRTLRVLFVEDSEDDVLLLREELRRAGYDVVHAQVETVEAAREALSSGAWDIVLCEYALRGWDALGALALVHELGLDLPFIIVSGTIREEAAVRALKAGAHDFVSKNRLARFLPVVARELKEAAVRRERRRTEAALKEQERVYRRIVETAHEGIWILHEDGRTSYANQRMSELLGVSPDALALASFWDFVAEDSREAARLELEQAPAEVPRSVRLVRRDGGEFWAALATNRITDDDGAPLGILVMVADITERRRLAEQLMTSDRMASVGILAAGVAHEINNPLTAALWNLGAAQRDLAALAPLVGDLPHFATLSEGLRDTAEAAERVRDIARDLKIFSRAADDVAEPVDLVEVIESSARMARTEIRHRATVVNALERVPKVLANESRLGQVFLNLIVNAAQAIDEGHAGANEIVLATGVAKPGWVYAEVRDTGGGMPPAVLERLFTPFFTTKPPGVGTGLGLSICHRIVTALGGEISATSAVGVGSTFRVVLPAAEVPTSVSDAVVTASPMPTRRGRVLIVDDEAIILKTLTRIISFEHDVEAFERAAPALEKIRGGERFDVIVSDLMMPEMTGFDLHGALSEEAPDQAARMVFLTGGAFTQRAREFLDAVDNVRFEKPFNPAQLLDLVNARVG